MKAYKIEILIIDHDNLGPASLKNELENANFANDCINIQIKNMIEKDIGEWTDDHPLNNRLTQDQEYINLFNN